MKKEYILLLLCSILAFNGNAQGSSTLYLFDIQINAKDIQLTEKKKVNVNDGYNNQPYFHPVKDVVYYASTTVSGHTDIFSYNLNSGATVNFSNSYLSSEYSPTVTPDARWISSIVQGLDGSQHLVKHPIDSGNSITLIDDLLVGYHIWLDDERLVTFILNGETNDLFIHDFKAQTNRILSKNIGRCFQHVPGQSKISFIQLGEDGKGYIKTLDKINLEIHDLTNCIDDSQDYVWTNDGHILMANGSMLHKWDARTGWQQILDLSKYGLNQVSRMAINADNTKIVFVSADN